MSSVEKFVEIILRECRGARVDSGDLLLNSPSSFLSFGFLFNVNLNQYCFNLAAVAFPLIAQAPMHGTRRKIASFFPNAKKEKESENKIERKLRLCEINCRPSVTVNM